MRKKPWSLVLALAFCLALLSAGALAAEDKAVVSVTVDGETTEYSNIFTAFASVEKVRTATITLLDDVYLPANEDERFSDFPGKIEFRSSGSVTLDLNGHLLTQADIGFTDGYTPNVIEMLYGTLTITGKGTIYQRYKTSAISVSSQSVLTIDGDDVTVKADFTYGSKQFPTDSSRAIAINGGVLEIRGGTFTATSGVALEYTEGNVRLDGGSFNGIKILTYKYPGKINEGVYVTDLLAPNRTYRHTNGDVPANFYVQEISDVKVVEGLTPVPYVDENGNAATATEYIQIEPTTTKWTEGLYVVKGKVAIPGDVTVSGKMPHIILCDGASLTVNGGVTLPDGRPEALTIYGQTGGTGNMTVTNQSGAAFSTASPDGLAVLRLLRGTLTATGKDTAFSDVMVWNQLGYGNDEVKCIETGSDPGIRADGQHTLSVTLSRCTEHSWSYEQHKSAEQHLRTCALCGYNESGAGGYENCVYDIFFGGDENGHKEACRCHRTKPGVETVAHTPDYIPNADGKTHGYRCAVCGFFSDGTANPHEYVDGACKFCKYQCPHEDTDKTVGSATEGVCRVCHERVCEARLVRDNGKVLEHYATVEEALARYTSVSDAIVTLLCDKDMGDGALVVTYEISGKELDLGGHTLSGRGDAVFQINKRYGFTLHNGTVKNTGTGDAIQLIHGTDPSWGGAISDGELTVEDLTVTAAKGWAIRVMEDASDADLYIRSGTLTGGLNAGTISGGHKVQISGGTFIANPDTHSIYYPGSSLTDTLLVGRLKDMLAAGFTYGDAAGNTINYFAAENRTIIGKSQYNYPKGVYLNATTVTIVPHTSHPIDRETGVCSICGAPCSHIETDENGLCIACGARIMFCEAEGTLYKTLQAAQEELKDRTDNPVVKLLADYWDNVSLLGTENGYTLDLNGFRVQESPVIMLEGRTLTITDSSAAKTGGLGELQISGGTAYLRDGIYAAIAVSHGAIKITGEGTVKITQKIEMPGKFIASGEYSNDWKVADMLNPGYAVYLVDESAGTETLVNGYLNVNKQPQQFLPGPNRNGLTLKDGQYYTVKPHRHDMADSTVTTCACGVTCTHERVSGDGVCEGCAAVFTAKLTDSAGKSSYYADGVYPDSGNTRSGLDVAFEQAETGSTVTVLGGSSATAWLDGGKALTLELNGKTVSSLYLGRSDGVNSLTVTGTGDIGSLYVHKDNTADLTGWAGKMDLLYVYGGGKVTLTGGTFEKITLNGNSAGALLAPGCAFRYADGSYVPYDATADVEAAVSVVKCTFEGWYSSEESASCPHCAGKAAIRVPVTVDGAASYAFYLTLQKAVDEPSYDDTKAITLLEAVSGDCRIGEKTIFAMNNKKIDGTVTANDAELGFESKGGEITAVTLSGSGAKFGLLGRGSVTPVMGTLTIENGAAWAGILPSLGPDRYGYKIQTDSGYIWKDSDTAGGTVSVMHNVSIGRLPIPKTSLRMKVNEKDVIGVELETPVQLVAGCGTGSTAAVTFYLQKEGSETIVQLTGVTASGGDYVSEYAFPEDGKYTVWFEATRDGYTARSDKSTLNISKHSIPAEAITLPQVKTGLVYDGTAQELFTPGVLDPKYGTFVYGALSDYSTEVSKATDAGTYLYGYKILGNENYAGVEHFPLAEITIAKRELTVEDVEVGAKTYDGTNAAAPGQVTFGNTLESETPGYAVSGVYEDCNAGGGRAVLATVELRGNLRKNYQFAGGTDQTTFRKTGLTIAKAPAPAAAAGTLTVTNHVRASYTVDLAALVPTLGEGCTYGTLTYGSPSLQTEGLAEGESYSLISSVDKNGQLTLRVEEAASAKTGPVGTITVPLSSDNYQDIPLTVRLHAKNKAVPVPDGPIQASVIVYGQTVGQSTLTGAMKAGDAVVEGDFAWKTPDAVLNAGTHDAAWTFTPKDTDKYAGTTGTASLLVQKAPQSAAVRMESYVYGETPAVPGLESKTGDGPVTYYYKGTGDAAEWKDMGPKALNAGTYSLYAVLGETENYSAFTTPAVTFRVKKAQPAYTKPGNLGAKYGQTLAEIPLPAGWSWMDGGEPVGAPAASKTFPAKFTPGDPVNYETVENIPLEVRVVPAPGGSLGTAAREQKYTDRNVHTFAPDWSALPTGETWSYGSDYTVSAGSGAVLTRQDVSAAEGVLFYAVSGGKTGDQITVTLRASCANYEDFTFTLTITLTAREDQAALTVTGEQAVTYGETLTLRAAGGSGTGAVTFTVAPGGTGEAVVDENGVLTPVRAGEVTVFAHKAGDAEYNEVTSAPFVVTIHKALSSGEPKYTLITAGGRTLADAGLTAAGSILYPAEGTLTWVDEAGEPLPEATVVEGNKAYTWRFVPADGNHTQLEGTVVLYTPTGGETPTPPVYPVNAPETAENGKISSSGKRAPQGSTVTITVTPEKGFRLEELLVTDKNGNALPLTDKGDGRYTFTMPAGPVDVAARFAPLAETGSFADVPADAYYAEAVRWAAENGITGGVGNGLFGPDRPCTRAQIVTFLWRAAGSPEPTTMSSFTDVPADSYYAKAVAWAVENGITTGTGDGKFSPEAPCTRAQAVTFLARAKKALSTGTAAFTDVPADSYYAAAVAWAVETGVTQGVGEGIFAPNVLCTRAQIVTFLYRASR